MSEKLIEHKTYHLWTAGLFSQPIKKTIISQEKKQKEFKFACSKFRMQKKNKNKIHLFLLVADNIFKIWKGRKKENSS